MIDTADLLGYICQDADMGRSAIKHVRKLCRDDSLQQELSRQHTDYEKAYNHAAETLERLDEGAPGAKPFAKLMANLGTDIHTLTDDSPSKIAELMIQGNTMGITALTRQIHEYDGSNKEVLDMAHKQVALQQSHIETLKAYL